MQVKAEQPEPAASHGRAIPRQEQLHSQGVSSAQPLLTTAEQEHPTGMRALAARAGRHTASRGCATLLLKDLKGTGSPCKLH